VDFWLNALISGLNIWMISTPITACLYRSYYSFDKLYLAGYYVCMNTIQTTEVFDSWFSNLKDRTAKARIQARIDRVEEGNFGDCQPVGEGVSEMRIHTGPGYRIYFKQVGMEIFVLLAGGNKATQQQDIKGALELAHKIGG